MKAHVANVDQTRWKVHIFGTGLLRTSQQTLVKHFVFQREHGITPDTRVPVLLNRIEDMLVEMGIMRKPAVPTVEANSLLDSIMQITAPAAFDSAEIVGHGIETQETNQ